MKVLLSIVAGGLVLASFSGCLGSFAGSGGFDTRAIPSTSSEADNPFKLAADNWLEFDGDLTTAVDGIFASIRAGNRDAEKLVGDFVRPGLEVLGERYGIVLPTTEPTANPRAREFRFQTEWSPWRTSSGNSANLPVTKVLLHPVEPGNCRWRGRIVESHAKFNSYSPKRIFVHFVLEIAVEVRASAQDEWKLAAVDQQSYGSLAQSMRKDILNRYRTYMSSTYNVDTSSPRFKGFNDN